MRKTRSTRRRGTRSRATATRARWCRAWQHLRLPHARALLDSLEAEAQAEQFAEDLPHEAAPASFADLMNVINDLRNKLRQSGIEV